MARWSVWTASALGAVGAGAGLALARRRRAPAPAPAGPIAPLPTADVPAPEPLADAGAPGTAEDAQAALDAARERLRDRAERLRRDIEASGGEPPGTA
jgi:hypothetical protein